MDIGTGLAAITNALAVAKALKSVETSYDQAQLKGQIAEIYGALAEAKLALVDAKAALSQRDDEIARLKLTDAERLTLKVGDGGYSYRVEDKGDPLGFPVCPKCDPLDALFI
jgi:hypothetical protein